LFGFVLLDKLSLDVEDSTIGAMLLLLVKNVFLIAPKDPYPPINAIQIADKVKKTFHNLLG
jgi:hypothetical protein